MLENGFFERNCFPESKNDDEAIFDTEFFCKKGFCKKMVIAIFCLMAKDFYGSLEKFENRFDFGDKKKTLKVDDLKKIPR